MARKTDGAGSNGSGLEALEGLDFPLKEQLIFTASSDWTPDQAEQYIDWRIQQIDGEIARLRQQLDDLIAARKRWLAVTGGRSKISTNGHTNGTGGSNGGTSHSIA